MGTDIGHDTISKAGISTSPSPIYATRLREKFNFSHKNFKILEVPIKILYSGDTSTHNPISHGSSVILSTIKFTSIEHPLKFYGIPSVIFFAIGLTFTYFSAQYYAEIGRLNTNLTIVAAGTILIAVVLFELSVILISISCFPKLSKSLIL